MENLPPLPILLCVWFRVQSAGSRFSQMDWQDDRPIWDSEVGGVSLSQMHLDSVSPFRLMGIDSIG
jgi:hypothetical protein